MFATFDLQTNKLAWDVKDCFDGEKYNLCAKELKSCPVPAPASGSSEDDGYYSHGALDSQYSSPVPFPDMTSNKQNILSILKKNLITFVGKLNKSKGYDIFGSAVLKILRKHKKWVANVVGDELRDKIYFKHENLFNFGFGVKIQIRCIFLCIFLHCEELTTSGSNRWNQGQVVKQNAK